MNSFPHSMLVSIGVILSLGFGIHPTNGTAAAQQDCGPLVRWKLPEDLVVYSSASDDRTADVLVTQARLDAIILAAETYCRLNRGAYPSTFKEMVVALPGMTQCTLEDYEMIDAWDHPIFYAVQGGHPVVSSAGPDGRFTTPDDIGWPTGSGTHTEAFTIPAECSGP